MLSNSRKKVHRTFKELDFDVNKLIIIIIITINVITINITFIITIIIIIIIIVIIIIVGCRLPLSNFTLSKSLSFCLQDREVDNFFRHCQKFDGTPSTDIEMVKLLKVRTIQSSQKQTVNTRSLGA